MNYTFIENENILSDQDEVIDLTWTKPIDSDGIYDPTVKLHLWQFNKLTITDQIEYLLMQVYQDMCRQDILTISMEVSNTIVDGGPLNYNLKRKTINPREPITEDEKKTINNYIQSGRSRGPYQKRYRANGNGWFNYDNRYYYVYLEIWEKKNVNAYWSYEDTHHILYNNSQYSKHIIWMLTHYLLKMTDDHKYLEPVFAFYTTALCFTSKPPKFRNYS